MTRHAREKGSSHSARAGHEAMEPNTNGLVGPWSCRSRYPLYGLTFLRMPPVVHHVPYGHQSLSIVWSAVEGKEKNNRADKYC